MVHGDLCLLVIYFNYIYEFTIKNNFTSVYMNSLIICLLHRYIFTNRNVRYKSMSNGNDYHII